MHLHTHAHAHALQAYTAHTHVLHVLHIHTYWHILFLSCGWYPAVDTATVRLMPRARETSKTVDGWLRMPEMGAILPHCLVDKEDGKTRRRARMQTTPAHDHSRSPRDGSAICHFPLSHLPLSRPSLPPIILSPHTQRGRGLANERTSPMARPRRDARPDIQPTSHTKARHRREKRQATRNKKNKCTHTNKKFPVRTTIPEHRRFFKCFFFLFALPVL